MTNLIEKGEQTLSRLLGTSASVSIVYRRGEEAVELPAVVGLTAYEIATQFGVEPFQARDYIIDRSDLVLPSGLTVPQKGDRIWQQKLGVTLVYEVSTPGDMQCYESSGETRWRIHTKLIDEL
jgi:hypothetical protein